MSQDRLWQTSWSSCIRPGCSIATPRKKVCTESLQTGCSVRFFK